MKTDCKLWWFILDYFLKNNSLQREKFPSEFNKNTWPQILQEIPKHVKKEFMEIFLKYIE